MFVAGSSELRCPQVYFQQNTPTEILTSYQPSKASLKLPIRISPPCVPGSGVSSAACSRCLHSLAPSIPLKSSSQPLDAVNRTPTMKEQSTDEALSENRGINCDRRTEPADRHLHR